MNNSGKTSMAPSKAAQNSATVWLWGTTGARLVARLQGKKLSTKDERELKRAERAGYCPTYGALPVHLMVNVVIPLAFIGASAEMGIPQGSFSTFIVASVPSVLALMSSQLPVAMKTVKKSCSVNSVIRKRQLKVYAASFAAIVTASTALAGHDKSNSRPNVTNGNDVFALPTLELPSANFPVLRNRRPLFAGRAHAQMQP